MDIGSGRFILSSRAENTRLASQGSLSILLLVFAVVLYLSICAFAACVAPDAVGPSILCERSCQPGAGLAETSEELIPKRSAYLPVKSAFPGTLLNSAPASLHNKPRSEKRTITAEPVQSMSAGDNTQKKRGGHTGCVRPSRQRPSGDRGRKQYAEPAAACE